MTRSEFMNELAAQLRYLPHEDLDSVLQYYEEYFDEAGCENEQTVIAELKSPAHIAASILSDYAVKEARKTGFAAKSGWKAFWFTILAICAAPVALPLVIAAVAGVFALGITGIAMVIALFAAAVIIFITGIAVFSAKVATAIALFGTALVLIGAALLVFYGVCILISHIGKQINKKSNLNTTTTNRPFTQRSNRKMKKKLYRSIRDKKLFGVCGGFAEYFDIDVTLIRILWLAALFIGGSGLLLYIICALVMPIQHESSINYEYTRPE